MDHPVVHPGDTGPAVDDLFQALSERGLAVDPSDRAAHVYDKTRSVVHDFQASHGLTADEIVGGQTWAALENFSSGGDFIPFSTEGLDPFSQMALAVAKEEFLRPVLEQPMHSNRGPRVDEYLIGHRGDGRWLLKDFAGPGTGAAPWCGRFALWIVEEAAQRMSIASPVAGWGDLASAAKWLAQGKARNRMSSVPYPNTLNVGCIITGNHGHVVPIAQYLPGELQPLITIEGNHGDRVAMCKRQLSDITAFVQVTP